MVNPVCIRTFANRIAAEIAQARLESAGVDAFIVADDAGGAAPYIAYVHGGARLMVGPDDAQRAEAILGEMESDPGL